MPSLLETWAPVADDFGFIRAPLARVVSELKAWHGSLGIGYSTSEITTSLGDAFASLPPLTNDKTRRLFVATRSDWVACFQNGIQGSDPFPAMSHLACRMGVLAMRVCATNDAALYPGVAWEVYAPESLGGKPPLGYRRSLAAINDGGRWTFEQSGEPFPFEQIAQYTQKRKRDRFTREMLGDYLREFGITAFADDFFRIDPTSPAVRLELLGRGSRTPEFTLEQVVAGVPWQR